jgi:hypothetical protein
LWKAPVCRVVDKIGGDKDEVFGPLTEDGQILLHVGRGESNAIDHYVPRDAGRGNCLGEPRFVIAVRHKVDRVGDAGPLPACDGPDRVPLRQRGACHGAAQEAAAADDEHISARCRLSCHGFLFLSWLLPADMNRRFLPEVAPPNFHRGIFDAISAPQNISVAFRRRG